MSDKYTRIWIALKQKSEGGDAIAIAELDEDVVSEAPAGRYVS